MIRRRLGPQPGPQETFLSTPADIAVYGGAAGGGKSWSLLYDPLRHIKVPGFGGVIFRRTSPQITSEGGLWDEASALYTQVGARMLVGSLEAQFPDGPKLSFRHLQHEKNKLDWQGSAICFLGFDELTHFLESQFWYMTSRNRSKCGVRPYVRASTNPDASSWVKTFLAQWVDKRHKDPAKSGELRWFVRVNGEVHWAHAPDELLDRFPPPEPKPGEEPDPALIPRSVTFVKAKLSDNKILMRLDPGYLGNLQALPAVERARLLDGDWDVKREGLVYPGLPDCIVEKLPEGLDGKRRGGIDFGFNDPFAALGGVLDGDDVLWLVFERYKSGVTLPIHSEALPKDHTEWYADPSRPDSITELRHAGHNVYKCVHKGKKPIVTGIDRVNDRIRTGRLKILRTPARA